MVGPRGAGLAPKLPASLQLDHVGRHDRPRGFAGALHLDDAGLNNTSLDSSSSHNRPRCIARHDVASRDSRRYGLLKISVIGSRFGWKETHDGVFEVPAERLWNLNFALAG